MKKSSLCSVKNMTRCTREWQQSHRTVTIKTPNMSNTGIYRHVLIKI